MKFSIIGFNHRADGSQGDTRSKGIFSMRLRGKEHLKISWRDLSNSRKIDMGWNAE